MRIGPGPHRPDPPRYVPPGLYADLVAASAQTGVPLPLLLGVGYTESRWLQYGRVANAALTPPGTSVWQGAPVGLLQVSRPAALQVRTPYPLVVLSARANAVAGARYLAYLARQHGLAPAAPLGPAWRAVLTAYGEPTGQSLALAQDPAWVRAVTPPPRYVAVVDA